MGYRLVVVEHSGEGREVLGLGAAVVGVSWVDFGEVDEAIRAKWGVVNGLIASGFSASGFGEMCKGKGESFRLVEFGVFNDATGKRVAK